MDDWDRYEAIAKAHDETLRWVVPLLLAVIVGVVLGFLAFCGYMLFR